MATALLPSMAHAAARSEPCRVHLERLLAPACGCAEEHAARLVGRFGSLAAVFAADEAALRPAVDGCAPALELIAATRAAMLHVLHGRMTAGPVLSAPDALRDYLSARLAGGQAEILCVLFLNARNELIRDEIVATGSPTELRVHEREVLKRALELGATALILAHNHPSGCAEPSEMDILATARIARAARTLDIAVHDHVIVARGGRFASMRALGLM